MLGVEPAGAAVSEEQLVAMRPDLPSIRLSRRGKIFIGVLVSLVIIISLLGTGAGIYANWLWFGEVHYHRVYSTILLTRVVIFLVVGLVIALVIGLNVMHAYRVRPPFRPISPEQENLERYRLALEPRKKWIFIVAMLLVFFIAGMNGQNEWKIWQLWRNGVSFGTKDPQFHRDIGWFAWDYPFYRALLGFGFATIIFSLIFALVVHYVFGALRVVTPGPKLTISARRHITVLVFFFIVLKACAYWLDRYGLVFSNRGHVTGASYTDVNASLPAKTILFWVAVLIAIAVLASLWLRSAIVAGVSFIVLLVLSIAINGIYPFAVQQLTVKPNASTKEAPYIARNIAATRQAYNVVTNDATSAGSAALTPVGTGGNGIGPVSYDSTYGSGAQASSASLLTDTQTIPNVRITDPNIVSPTFTNVQQLKNYYGFADKLDIDRYDVNGTTSDYIVGVRELKAANLTGDQTNWINEHTVYTHGYGLVAAKASGDVSDASDFAIGNIPSTVLTPGFPAVTVPQVYYGELGVDYSIVGAQGAPRENDGADGKSTYNGSGGISLSSLATRLTFAVKYGEPNFILNSVVSTKGAKIMFDRDPRQRVLKVAPFLQVDGDPYPAIVDGRIVWIVDAYTTMSNYPYSQRESFGQATSNTFSATGATVAQANNQINYIRNSVKATVDAYTGAVNLYSVDNTDPVLKTWEKVFPGVIKPSTSIPTDIKPHLRYPEDLFDVQRAVLASYHVSDPVQFYNARDVWTVPTDPTPELSPAPVQPPYYILSGANAGTGPAEYQLTSPMQVNGRPNMAAYISVNSEYNSADYGKMTVLRLPTDSSVLGITQIFNAFNTNTTISKDLSLLSTGGSRVLHGNLLTIPIGNTFLYVEPLYVVGTGDSAFPLLRRVLTAYGETGTPGYADNLTDSLTNLGQSTVGLNLDTGTTPTTTPSTSPPTSSSPPTTTAPTSVSPTSQAAAVNQLNTAYTNLQTALKSGNLSEIQSAEAALVAAAGRVSALSPTSATPSATPKATASPSK
jgi:uncharacterized membrane protein (UPF0182 family)